MQMVAVVVRFLAISIFTTNLGIHFFHSRTRKPPQLSYINCRYRVNGQLLAVLQMVLANSFSSEALAVRGFRM